MEKKDKYESTHFQQDKSTILIGSKYEFSTIQQDNSTISTV